MKFPKLVMDKVTLIPSPHLENKLETNTNHTEILKNIIKLINWYNLLGLLIIIVTFYILYRRYQNKKNYNNKYVL